MAKEQTRKIKKTRPPLLIGATDILDLPQMGIFDLPCKIDTGADTSSIHCDQILIKKIDGEDHLVFKLLDKNHPLFTGEEIIVKEFKEKVVRSSFGEQADRFQIKITVNIFGRNIKTPFNLSHRPGMRYPVLLGKRFLRRGFLVDVSKKDLNQKWKSENTN